MHISISSTSCAGAISCPASIATDSYQELSDKMWAIADALKRWNDERSALLALRTPESPELNRRQHARLCDLNSSLDSYAALLEDVEDMPVEPWIERANATSVEK